MSFPNKKVCVDASLVLKLVLAEEYSDKADALWTEWIEKEIHIFAPPLLAFEMTSVIRNHVYRGNLTEEEGEMAFEAAFALGITFDYPEMLHQKAWELAKQFNRPTAYDTHYLALALIEGCKLWTADKRLYNAVGGALSCVRWVGDYRGG